MVRIISKEDMKPKQHFLCMVDYYNKSEWKFTWSIIEENNTTVTIFSIFLGKFEKL